MVREGIGAAGLSGEPEKDGDAPQRRGPLRAGDNDGMIDDFLADITEPWIRKPSHVEDDQGSVPGTGPVTMIGNATVPWARNPRGVRGMSPSLRRKPVVKDQVSDALQAADQFLTEKSPPGFSGTVKAMKRHKEIDNPYALCLAGDTRVPLLDGRVLTMEQLACDYGDGTPFWVYSFDTSFVRECSNVDRRRRGFFVPGLAHHPRITGTAQLMEITLDSCEKIRCTFQHPFLLHDGSYKPAYLLLPGDSLRPLNRRTDDKGYEEFDCGYGLWHKTHLHVLGYNNLVERRSDGTFKFRFTVHHQDFNNRNNRPDNLEKMIGKNHQELHALLCQKWSEEGVKALARWREANTEKLHEMVVQNGRLVGSTYGVESLVNYNRSAQGRCKSGQNLSAWNRSDSHRRMVSDSNRRRCLEGRCGHLSHQGRSNHKIVSVDILNDVVPVYDISVDNYHNFALDAGIFVHNSWWMKKKGYKSHEPEESVASVLDAAEDFLLSEAAPASPEELAARPPKGVDPKVWSHVVTKGDHVDYGGARAHYNHYVKKYGLTVPEPPVTECWGCGERLKSENLIPVNLAIGDVCVRCYKDVMADLGESSLDHQPAHKPVNRTPANFPPKVVPAPAPKPKIESNTESNTGDSNHTVANKYGYHYEGFTSPDVDTYHYRHKPTGNYLAISASGDWDHWTAGGTRHTEGHGHELLANHLKSVHSGDPKIESDDPFADKPYHEWTPCEAHGHRFEDGVCVDCGERAEPSDDSKPKQTESISFFSGSPTDTTRLHGSIRIKVLDEVNFAIRAPDRIIDQVEAYHFFEQFQILLPRTPMLSTNVMFRISEWWKNFARRGDILEIDCVSGFATVLNETTGNFYAIGHFGNAPDFS